MTWLSSLCPFLLPLWHLVGLDRARVRIKTFRSHHIVIVQCSCSAWKYIENIISAFVLNVASLRPKSKAASLRSKSSNSCRHKRETTLQPLLAEEFLQYGMMMLRQHYSSLLPVITEVTLYNHSCCLSLSPLPLQLHLLLPLSTIYYY